jgi:hypothetical protein
MYGITRNKYHSLSGLYYNVRYNGSKIYNGSKKLKSVASLEIVITFVI